MAAQMKIEKWQVGPAARGDIEVSLSAPDGNGKRHAIIEHSGDFVWVDAADVPALIEALQTAANALKAVA